MALQAFAGTLAVSFLFEAVGSNLGLSGCGIVGAIASMGAFLLAAGAKGKRLALPNSVIMIHQPLGGAQGQASDVKIHAEQILKTRTKLNEILAANTGKPLEVIERDTDRDNFMSAAEAAAYGLIDKVIEKHA